MDENLIIETHDRTLVSNLFNKTEIKSGDTIEIKKGITVTWKYADLKKMVGIPEVLHFVVSYGPDIARDLVTGLVGSWLYDKIKRSEKKTVSVKLNNEELKIQNNQKN